jgi:type I restriction-modification system DNA methylase subunit
MKKEETNDIIQYLIPKLEEIGIAKDYCKVDVTTEKTGNKRGDIWVSKKKQAEIGFEKNIIALIEAKHRNCIKGDMDWRDAMRHGKEKSTRQGLTYYIATNCISDFRFYNTFNDEEINLDGKTITRLQPSEILEKIGTQVNESNSYVVHKISKSLVPFSETKFRTTLKNLADIYRSAGLKKGDERIDPTVSFVVLKYIGEKERGKRTLPKEINLWGDFSDIAIDENADLNSDFIKIIRQMWDEESEYKENIYKDFKDLVIFSPKLKNQHFKKIYKELNGFHFHGCNFDIYGSIYEEFASQTKKKDFGEFYTRRHITGVVARLLLRNEITGRDLKLCDPACGTGGFLTEAYKSLKGNYYGNGKLNEDVIKKLENDTFWGLDNDEKSVARTKLNMFLVGDGHTHIYEIDDSLGDWNKSIGWQENNFDYIMTNPPMGKYEGGAQIEDFKFTNEKRYELLFTEKILKATKHGGEIAVVINDGALEAPSRENFREKLLQHCDIYAIISLTKFAFAPYTKEKTYILFMRKKQKEDIGTIQDFPIWHFVVDYDGFANSDKRYRTKYHDDLPELEEKFDGAVKLARFFEDKKRFEMERGNFEREINEREKEEELTGMKYGYVDMVEINERNFHNLLSEFHLRPVKRIEITKEEYIKRLNQTANSIDQLHKIKEDIISKVEKTNATSFEECPIKKMFHTKGGNSGLTEEFTYYNLPTNEDEIIEVFTGATLDENKMGIISRLAKPNGRELKIFQGPAILIVRKGLAGKMFHIEKEEFTTNDDAYVLIPKKDWKEKINLRWFIHEYQNLFFNLVTSKSDNATFNKGYANRQNVKIPDIDFQNVFVLKIDPIESIIKKSGKIKKKADKLLEYVIV